jgi:short-subunit dehydrogenase
VQTVLITGATSGLGLELAKRYQNERLILLGRRIKLESELFQKHLYIQCDLSQPEAAALIVKELERHHLQHLDLLIHNAALGYYGQMLNQSNKNLHELLQVNLYTPITLTKALFRHMQNGKVVFINSIAANVAAPDYAVYAASKAALSGFARNLRIEGKLKVQTIYPGAIRTPFHAKSGVPKGRFNETMFPSVDKVAKDIYKAIQTNKAEVTIGGLNKLVRNLGYYFPLCVDKLMRSRT